MSNKKTPMSNKKNNKTDKDLSSLYKIVTYEIFYENIKTSITYIML